MKMLGIENGTTKRAASAPDQKVIPPAFYFILTITILLLK